MKNKKQKTINYLFKKLDNIKLELHNINYHRNLNLNLYDFEKDLRIVGHEQKLLLKKKTKKVDNENLILEVKKYLTNVKFIPLAKVIGQTSKILFYDEFLYILRENDFIKRDFLCLSKKKQLVTENNKVTENSDSQYKYIDKNKEIRSRLHDDLITYFIMKKLYLPAKVCLYTKNHADTQLLLLKKETKNIDDAIIKKPRLKQLKQKTNIFKECHAENSIFYKFIKTVQSTNLHQSYKKINEKFTYQNLRFLNNSVSSSKSRISSFYYDTAIKQASLGQEEDGFSGQTNSVQKNNYKFTFYDDSKK